MSGGGGGGGGVGGSSCTVQRYRLVLFNSPLKGLQVRHSQN